MGIIFSIFFREKREHNLTRSESYSDLRIAWEKSNYTSEEISQLLNTEYSKSSKFI